MELYFESVFDKIVDARGSCFSLVAALLPYKLRNLRKVIFLMFLLTKQSPDKNSRS